MLAVQAGDWILGGLDIEDCYSGMMRGEKERLCEEGSV